MPYWQKQNIHYIEMYERLNIISVKHSINIPNTLNITDILQTDRQTSVGRY